MAKPIRISIRGSSGLGDDAPTVEDLLSQIEDFVKIFDSIESAVSESRTQQLVWRITDATKNSPLTLEITPYPKNHATNIDRLAREVVSVTAHGLLAFGRFSERPLYFSDDVMKRATGLFDRLTNGLAETTFDPSEYTDVPVVRFDKQTAQLVLKGINAEPKQKIIYRELGSIEGHIAKIELDVYQRPIIWLRERIDGETIKCISHEGGLNRIGHYEVDEVLRGLRVQVFGTIHYKDLEKVNYVEVDDVHVYDDDNELPDLEDIVSPNFTEGVEAVEYLRSLRKDG